MKCRYPIYVISKGRHTIPQPTWKALDRMSLPYSVVIEPQEFDKYASIIEPERIKVLPFSNLGQGSIPARNWVWEHALSTGAERHWIMDDNIENFGRLNRNMKIWVNTGAIVRAAEDFVDRYENVALAGFHYDFFAKRKDKLPPFMFNRRIYSCILIKNDLSYRWRGRYNEDTDLSLRVLKDRWCTILFYAFLIYKATTMTLSGGNTQELYSGDGRLKMAESLKEQHPDVTRIVQKFGRYQHQVDYRLFKTNQLILKSGIAIPEGINDYGMVLQNFA
jgi:hypothetical protein